MIYCKFYRVQCKIMNVLHELDGRVTLSSVLYENRIILTTSLFINWWIYNATNYPHMNFISFEKSIHSNFTGNFTWNSLHMIFHKKFSHKFPVFSTITKYKIMSHALKLKFTFHEIHILFSHVIHFVMLKCQCSLSCEFYMRYDFLYMYVCYSLFFTCN